MDTFSEQTANALQAELRSTLSGEVHFEPVMRGIFSTDASHYQIMPLGVVFPKDELDVTAAIKLAARHRVPVTVRGAGTSLSGQTHGPGLILDVSRHMDQIVAIDPKQGIARVMPGVVRDQLNTAAGRHGLFFAPDPATSSRCTIGGMIGNNSAGMRSVRYGQTSQHLIRARVALASGEILELAEGIPGPTHPLVQGLQQILELRRAEIAARYPDVPRQVGGYALDAFGEDPSLWNLARLLCGSEGTLAILLEATVRLEPIPSARALCVVQFESVDDALRPLPQMLEHEPTAIELLDEIVIREAVVNPSTRHLTDFLRDGSLPNAVQIVEFSGDEAASDAERFASAMAARGIGVKHPVFTEPETMHGVWEVRRLGLGLITNTPGPKKGQAFIEDACIPVDQLAAYIRDVREICSSHELSICVYAHASVGVLHVRPLLDLHDANDISRMRAVSEAVFERVVHYGGAWSGEHGDGIVRGEYLERYFGPELMQAFREVKVLFDPMNLLNPNKLIDPPPMTEHLRYQQPGYAKKMARTTSHFKYRAQGGLGLAVEQCNGVGACRKLAAGVMCPSFRATRKEADCTRGRANALRLAISGQLGDTGLADDGLADTMSLCLGCKACQSECPNAVDVAKFKAETLQARHDLHGVSPAARLIGATPELTARAVRFRPFGMIANLTAGPIARWVGFDARRPLPRIARRSFEALVARENATPEEADVILYNDSATNVYEPQIGLAAFQLLRDLGHRVHVATVGDSQRARISQGLLRDAKRAGSKVMQALAAFGEKPIVVLEPSCASSLAEDLPDLMDEPVKLDVVLLSDFLVRTGARVRANVERLVIHGHCHQKAVFGLEGLRTLLPSAEIIEAGCCGMAGAFGYQHYDLSLKIGADRLFPAVRKAAGQGGILVADGFSCRHQIAHACRVPVKHLTEVLEIVREP